MKNIWLYYMAILLPLPFLYYALQSDAWFFLAMLIAYVLYRKFTDAQRLIAKSVIPKEQFYKIFIPFWRAGYFRELFFEK